MSACFRFGRKVRAIAAVCVAICGMAVSSASPLALVDCASSTCHSDGIQITQAPGGGYSYVHLCAGDCAGCGTDQCNEKMIGANTSCFCSTDANSSGNNQNCRPTVVTTSSGSSVDCKRPCSQLFGCLLTFPVIDGVVIAKCACNG